MTCFGYSSWGKFTSSRVASVLLSALMFLGLDVEMNGATRESGLALTPQSSARYQCGPTTLASVLAYNGRPVPEATIAAAIYSPTAHGVLLTDLAWYARQAGFHTELRTGNLADLQNAVADGLPPIVLLDVGFFGLQQPHFTAITAWDSDEVLILNTKPAGKWISRRKFEQQWKLAGYQFLVIKPSS